MQTFLPYLTFAQSAAAMDNKRLPNQLVEVQVLILSLRDPSRGWQHHTALAMWRGYEDALLLYGVICYREWQRRLERGQRGGQPVHASGQLIRKWWKERGCPVAVSVPWWLGNEQFHASHRASLLHKAPEYYSQFGWVETPAQDLWWPTEHLQQEDNLL